MRFPQLTSAGISTRLVMIAVLPAAIMFIAISVTLYLMSVQDVQRDVEERGRLLSASLAQSSRYGVVSGNVAQLERGFKGLLSLDESIVAIEVQDWKRMPLVRAGRANESSRLTFETPIRAEALDIDVLDNLTSGHVATSDKAQVAGYIRVVMSAEPILRAKRRQIYLGAGFVFVAAAMSMLIGLALAQKLRSPLRSVMNALREIRQGQYEVNLGSHAKGELGELQDTIVEMARGLNVKRQELEDQVASRTQELQVAVDAAREADAERRRLLAHANDLIEEERRRIALEIHDSLNASLVSVRLLASSIVAKARTDGHDEVAQIAQRIADTTQELYGSVRSIAKQLRPEALDTLGLKGALEAMVRTYNEADPHCEFVFAADREFPVLRGSKAIAAYRAVQEALSNVVKHAQATRVFVVLEKDSADGRLRITIKDNGKGFDPSERSQGGLGIIGMRERLSGIGGSMHLETQVGAGTKVTLWLSDS